MTPLRDRIAVVLICLAPLAIIPGGENRFVFAKVVLTAAGVTVALAGVRRGHLPRVVWWLVGLGGLLLLLAAVESAEPLVAFVGRAPRFEGIPMLALYGAAGWAGAGLLGPDPPKDLTQVMLRTLCVTSMAVCVIAVIETAGLRPLASDVARPGSLLGNASDEGALGVLLFGALGWAFLSDLVWIVGLGAIAAGVTVALSASRAALLGLVVTCVILALGLPARRRLLVGAAVVVVGLLTLAVPASRGRVTGSSPLATATASGRILLWEETLALMGHHPALGVGPDNYLDAITVEHNLQWQRQVGPANPPDSPQDWVLQSGVDGGLVLVLITLALVAFTLRAGWRRLRGASDGPWSPAPGLFGGLVGYGIALLFGFTTPGTTPLALFFAGVLLAQPLVIATTHKTVRRAGRVALVAAGTVLTLWAGLSAIAEIPLQRGLEAAASGDLVAAQHNFEVAHDLRPWDVSIPQTAGHALVAIGSSTTGIASTTAARLAGPWLDQVQSALSDNEELALDQASLEELAGHYAQAGAILASALAADPEDPAVLLRLGVVEGESGRLAQAAADLNEVIHIDPTSAAPWNDLAVVYRLEHKSEAAARATARAQKLEHSS